ncbi:MAG: DUF2179 domain-containing protein [Anaerolineae bacterium]|nr:DUF2179 domain-containing protein [Anaerolineae bacterium]
MYTGAERTMLYITVARSQVADLREVVMHSDPRAFMVVGQGHVAYGGGFRPLNPHQVTLPPTPAERPPNPLP